MTLSIIQSEIKAPKGQMNKFGNYKYRSCEDIVEAAKPILAKHGFALTLTDEIVMIGNRFYVKATASIMRGLGEGEVEVFEVSAFAREEETKKGMDGAQITGAASSYARKYALNGLFAIDDTKDADATNNHSSDAVNTNEDDSPNQEERELLRSLVYSSTLSIEKQSEAFLKIKECGSYKEYDKIKHRLEDLQPSYDEIPNPSATDAKKIVRKISKQPA